MDCRLQHAPQPEPRSAKEEKEEERKQEEKEQEERGDQEPPTANSFLVDLAIRSNTPRDMVAGYVQAFHELHQEGFIDRPLVMLILYVPWW